MQNTEGITVSLSPEDITVLGDALSMYVLDISCKLERFDMINLQRTLMERKISQSKDLFHRLHKK